MPIAGDGSGKWSLIEKWILRQAVKSYITEEVYFRKKFAFNPPPSQAPALASGQLPLQMHLKKRITQANVERLGFIDWPFVKGQLEDYIAAPTFPPQGAIDGRASVLMRVLSYIVLQERFYVPSFTLSFYEGPRPATTQIYW
jgi:asparagine synthase (glutamine-hydrolysing)